MKPPEPSKKPITNFVSQTFDCSGLGQVGGATFGGKPHKNDQPIQVVESFQIQEEAVISSSHRFKGILPITFFPLYVFRKKILPR